MLMDDLQMSMIQYGIKLIARKLGVPSGFWPDGKVANDARKRSILDNKIQAHI